MASYVELILLLCYLAGHGNSYFSSLLWRCNVRRKFHDTKIVF